MTLEQVFGLYNYWVVICLMMTGFYIVIARKNMIKTVIGLNIFQTSVVLLYITMGKVTGGTAPIIPPEIVAEHANHGGHKNDHAEHGEHVDHAVDQLDHAHQGTHEIAADVVHHTVDTAGAAELIYSNPLPSVLMLTAIVVGIATTALALALIVRISEDYGTVEEDEIQLINRRERQNKRAS
jgi:multicomponent Na+:H+ antiporter subunit C